MSQEMRCMASLKKLQTWDGMFIFSNETKCIFPLKTS